jgi:hypothetical protein
MCNFLIKVLQAVYELDAVINRFITEINRQAICGDSMGVYSHATHQPISN